MKRLLFAISILSQAATAVVVAQQAAPPPAKPESPRKLAPRPIPGMTVPAKPAELPVLPAPKAMPSLETKPAETTSEPARILFIYRRGSFRLPDGAMEAKTPAAEGTAASQTEPAPPAPLVEGKIRIIPGPREESRAVPLASPAPPASQAAKPTPAKENQTP